MTDAPEQKEEEVGSSTVEGTCFDRGDRSMGRSLSGSVILKLTAEFDAPMAEEMTGEPPSRRKCVAEVAMIGLGRCTTEGETGEELTTEVVSIGLGVTTCIEDWAGGSDATVAAVFMAAVSCTGDCTVGGGVSGLTGERGETVEETAEVEEDTEQEGEADLLGPNTVCSGTGLTLLLPVASISISV